MHKHTHKWQEKPMQEKPYLFIFQGTQKDRKRQKLQLRNQFYYIIKEPKNKQIII